MNSGDDDKRHDGQCIGIDLDCAQSSCEAPPLLQPQPATTAVQTCPDALGQYRYRDTYASLSSSISALSLMPYSRYSDNYVHQFTMPFPMHPGWKFFFPSPRLPSAFARSARRSPPITRVKSIVLIGVLKGAAIFLSDLARAIEVDNTFDFVAVSSYGRAKVSSGAVKLIKDIDNPIEGKHVILVEDILDTGLTLSYLRGMMLQHKPASLKIATCLDKPERRLVPIEADYVGFQIPNQFVIGYGMDYAEHYRNVEDIRLFPENAAH